MSHEIAPTKTEPIKPLIPLTKDNVSSISNLLDSIFDDCVEKDVSDIHIDPQDSQVDIRIRLSGDLYIYKILDIAFHEELIGRIKILAKLRTDVHDKGQDGRFTYERSVPSKDESVHITDVENISIEKVDIRVSVLPTFYGENAVLRILRPERGRSYSFTDLGMFEDQAVVVSGELEKHQGMIIVAGPTGSGKTTTIYTMIAALIKKGRNVVTVEDPIEYLIPGIRQIQVSAHADFTFSKALRSVLRQDPDVIVIGEMRDGETASLAFQASLTGHLVITSLHAEDSAGVCARLRDLGISNQLLHSLTLLISQRIIRIPEVKSATKSNHIVNADHALRQTARSGVFEVMIVEGKTKIALFQNSFPEYIRLTLRKQGILLLQDSIDVKSNLENKKYE